MRIIPVTEGFTNKGVGELQLTDEAAALLDSDKYRLSIGAVQRHDNKGVFVNIIAIVPIEG